MIYQAEGTFWTMHTFGGNNGPAVDLVDIPGGFMPGCALAEILYMCYLGCIPLHVSCDGCEGVGARHACVV